MPNEICKATLNDVGTEELAHLEMIGTIVYQLTRNLTEEEIKASGFDKYFVDHNTAIYPASAAGVPWTAAYIQSKADVIADLTEDLAAEQKARATYDNILKLADDPDVIEPIKFLREREVVHFQRFGEAIRTNLRRILHMIRRCLFKRSSYILFKIYIKFQGCCGNLPQQPFFTYYLKTSIFHTQEHTYTFLMLRMILRLCRLPEYLGILNREC